MKVANKCRNCKKVIRNYNKTGICRNCYIIIESRKRRIRNRENRRCVSCGKELNKMILYPDGEDGIKKEWYPIRCYNCRNKYKKKNNGKELRSREMQE